MYWSDETDTSTLWAALRAPCETVSVNSHEVSRSPARGRRRRERRDGLRRVCGTQ